jgi:hypothetical protein
MDSLIRKIKEVLEEADPDITVTEVNDPVPKQTNGWPISEPRIDPVKE